MSGPDWELQIADELYCVLHDDRDGALQVNRQFAQVGLAGGLLAELLCAGRIRVDGGRVMVTDRLAPDGALARADAVVHQVRVLDQIAAQGSPVELSTWLAVLKTTSVKRVLSRLVGYGVWGYEKRWAIVRRRTVCVPKQMIFTSGRVALLANLLTSEDPIETPTAVLLGLIDATNMFDRVNWQPDTQAYGSQRLRHAVEALPAGHRLLLDCVRAEVDGAVLAPR